MIHLKNLVEAFDNGNKLFHEKAFNKSMLSILQSKFGNMTATSAFLQSRKIWHASNTRKGKPFLIELWFGWSGPQLNQTLILIFKSEFYLKQKGKIRHKQTSISIENVFSIFYNFPCHSSLPSGLAFIRFRNVHGPSPQPTALRTPANSLSILIGSNRAQGKLKTYFAKRARLRFIKLRL